MIDYRSLLADTNAYKTIKKDKEKNTLSHAYLVLCADRTYLNVYLKELAKLIMCDSDGCNNCRTCRLISDGTFSDVISYPTESGEQIRAEDVTDLIDQSYIKPLESDKKIFLLLSGETMSPTVQNKLLKILEEPPKNVCIIIGATGEYSLLPTVKSRVKRVEISAFSEQKIIDALKGECEDTEKLYEAVYCGDGTLGKAQALYGDEKLSATVDFVLDLLYQMKSSRQVLEYSDRFSKNKLDLQETLDVLELTVRDITVSPYGDKYFFNKKHKDLIKSGTGYNGGATLYIEDRILEARAKINANGSDTMVLEWLLFAILEGKHKWLKL